jgi:MSHA biogenesis protein MshP
MTPQRKAQRGFGVIAAIVVLVILSALAAALVRFGAAAQSTATQAVLAAQASQTARAGIEWGLYQAFKGSWTSCSNAGTTLPQPLGATFSVTVTCDSRSYNEGETSPGTPRTVRIYTIDAVACNGTGNCPDNTSATKPGYVERRRQVQATN